MMEKYKIAPWITTYRIVSTITGSVGAHVPCRAIPSA